MIPTVLGFYKILVTYLPVSSKQFIAGYQYSNAYYRLKLRKILTD